MRIYSILLHDRGTRPNHDLGNVTVTRHYSEEPQTVSSDSTKEVSEIALFWTAWFDTNTGIVVGTMPKRSLYSGTHGILTDAGAIIM